MSVSSLPPGWGEPSTPYGAPPPGNGAAPLWVYAGFWWRVWAFLIDAVILGVIETVLGFFIGPDISLQWKELPIPDGSGRSMDVVDVASYLQPQHVSVLVPYVHTGVWHGPSLCLALVPAVYFILFQSSHLGATPGKMACRLRLVTYDGGRVGFWRATLRFVIKAFISFPFFYIGVLMVAFTRRKQGLHDLIARTMVVRRANEQAVPFQPHD